MIPQGRPIALLCLLLSFCAHGADHQPVDASRIERLNTSLTTLITALKQSDATARQALKEAFKQRQQALDLAADGRYPEAASLLEQSLIEVKRHIATQHRSDPPLAVANTGGGISGEKTP